jgi:nitrogen-specific signal transduction histidine kinase
VNIYQRKLLFKGLLAGVVAPLIIFAALRYTQSLVMRLKAEERSRVELWAMATQRLITAAENESGNLDLVATIIENNSSVPLILTDGEGKIISHANFRVKDSENSELLEKELEKIRQRSEPIVIDLGEGHFNYIYYKDSTVLTKVKYYPWVQLVVILFFGALSYMAFSSSRRAEENQVWVGMSKETAHQLGTPVSSLSAWLEMIRDKHPDEPLTDEMQKDISRLEKITKRFSGIGSRPEKAFSDLMEITENTINYLKKRNSSKVSFNIVNNTGVERPSALINGELFEWVVENICKNAVDAMEGKGSVTIAFSGSTGNYIIDFIDTGRGIPRRLFGTIFKPGFTTRKTGWGLGLSLARRIIEEYHNGKIFVSSSEPGKGTCIRVILNDKP